jgi:hypothetical protein
MFSLQAVSIVQSLKIQLAIEGLNLAQYKSYNFLWHSPVFKSFTLVLRMYSKKNMVYGTHVEVDFNSPYLIVNSVSLLSTRTTKGKG